jgi:hypothetical protein
MDSLISVYRLELIRLLVDSGDDVIQNRIEGILRDKYALSMPIGGDKQIVKISYDGERIFDCLVDVCDYDVKTFSYRVRMYGSNNPSYTGRINSAKASIVLWSLLSYRSFKEEEAPFMVNWSWICSSMKKRLFHL